MGKNRRLLLVERTSGLQHIITKLTGVHAAYGLLLVEAEALNGKLCFLFHAVIPESSRQCLTIAMLDKFGHSL